MKKKMAVIFCVLLSAALLFTVCGAAVGDDWTFERNIDMIIVFGPGSGTDGTMRAFQPALERELGVRLVINNVAGASGVTGAEFFNAQPADGYTFAMYTPSHVIAAINGTATFDILNETVHVINLVQDINLILAGPNTPFNTFEELVERAKAEPGRFKIAVMSVAGIDNAAVQQLFQLVGVEIDSIAYPSGAEANAAVIGGHIDMVLTGAADGVDFIESGDMKGIIVLAEQRSSALPDVPSTGELGYEAYIGPWRGIVAKKGTPDGAVRAFQEAALKANSDPAWIEWKEANGLNDREALWVGSEFEKKWHEYYEDLAELLPLLQ
ncbi:MAG: tripartite tricarboxylate transporter substrate binding protein [Planctomycetes bacterium]|nr:tripartite tricarboxylate transporter substrate binding protein [Planctomycetota bacterium]